jgi:hypothetical protein
MLGRGELGGLLSAMTTKTNEQRVIDLVTAILKPLGYFAAVATTSARDDDFLLFWEKDLSSTDPDVPGLNVQLHRDLVEDDVLGEYWQSAWSIRVWLPGKKERGDGSWVQEPDKELSRTLLTLLEAVELLPKVETAVIAKYPHLLMKALGSA